jgi:hypothetical protein
MNRPCRSPVAAWTFAGSTRRTVMGRSSMAVMPCFLSRVAFGAASMTVGVVTTGLVPGRFVIGRRARAVLVGAATREVVACMTAREMVIDVAATR